MYRSTFSISALILLLIVFMPGCSKQSGDSDTSDKQNNTPGTLSEASNPIKGAGTIIGRVLFEGEILQPRKLIVVKDTDICGLEPQYDERLIVSENKGIQNAVVYLTGVSGGKPLSSLGSEFILDQRGCRYQPHVLVLPVNTSLCILNDDGILHNFHTFTKKNRPINVSQPGARKKMEIEFEHPEFIKVRCDLHGWMSGWIVAVDQPYYALTDEDGNFSMNDIPPGTYTLNCWQEILGEQTQQIIISPDCKESVKFTFSGERS